MTVVYGLPQNAEFLRELSQELKRACGTGGTAIDDGVELQGDLRERVREVLTKRGLCGRGSEPRSGGGKEGGTGSQKRSNGVNGGNGELLVFLYRIGRPVSASVDSSRVARSKCSDARSTGCFEQHIGQVDGRLHLPEGQEFQKKPKKFRFLRYLRCSVFEIRCLRLTPGELQRRRRPQCLGFCAARASGRVSGNRSRPTSFQPSACRRKCVRIGCFHVGYAGLSAEICHLDEAARRGRQAARRLDRRRRALRVGKRASLPRGVVEQRPRGAVG